MTVIKTKSGILSWNENNIENSPSECGVYILRTSPTMDSIKFIESSLNLHDDLLEKINDVVASEIEFFDWYTTDDFDDAKNLSTLWREKYIK